MTAIDDVLRRVGDLDKKAQPGPWCAESTGETCELTAGPIVWGPKDQRAADWLATFDRQEEGDDTYLTASNNACNAKFAAEARTLLPQLAEMVRVARAALQVLVDSGCDSHGDASRALTAMEKVATGDGK